MAATHFLMAALVVLGACPWGAGASCSDDFEVDLCDPEIKWEGCVDDFESDLCDPEIKWEACFDDPEADLCDDETVSTTTTTTVATRVSGTVSFSLPGVSKTLVEEGTRISVGAFFDVAASTVSVSATESRRLNADPRRLPGLWTVDYTFLAPATKVQAISAKVAAVTSSPDVFKAAFATELKAHLTASDVSADVVNALVVSDVTAVSRAATTTTTTRAPIVRVTGEVSFSVNVVVGGRAVVEDSARNAIAAYFQLDVSFVSVSGTGSFNWTVKFEFQIPPEQAEAIGAKVAAIQSSPDDFINAFTTSMKSYLITAGVDSSIVNALVVTDVTVTGHVTTGWENTNGAVRSQTGSAVAFMLAALLGGGAKSVFALLATGSHSAHC